MKNKIAVYVVAYNRPESLNRLLKSLSKVVISLEVDLIFSIDKSNNQNVLEIAENYPWNFGKKLINKRLKHLGLKAHILQLFKEASDYDYSIILEDDLKVSPFLFEYCLKALEFEKQEKVAGISLYSYAVNEINFQPFQPLEDGFDNYYLQLPSSWGLLLSRKEIKNFIDFENQGNKLKLPEYLLNWGKNSWKRQFANYLILTDKFFLYPRASLTTNFGDKGTHASGNNLFQTNLLLGSKEYQFSSIDQSNSVYDEYFELKEHIYKRLNPQLKDFNFSTNISGFKQDIKKDFQLISGFTEKASLSFTSNMHPKELNITCNQKGNDIHLLQSHSSILPFETFDQLPVLVNYIIEIKEVSELFVKNLESHFKKIRTKKIRLVILFENSNLKDESGIENLGVEAMLKPRKSFRLEQLSGIIGWVNDIERLSFEYLKYIEQLFINYPNFNLFYGCDMQNHTPSHVRVSRKAFPKIKKHPKIRDLLISSQLLEQLQISTLENYSSSDLMRLLLSKAELRVFDFVELETSLEENQLYRKKFSSILEYCFNRNFLYWRELYKLKMEVPDLVKVDIKSNFYLSRF